MKQDIKLGVFVFIGLLLFTFALLLVGRDKTLFQAAIRLTAEFPDAQGLRRGSNILLAGVKIGIVTEVDIVRDSTALVTMKIRKKYNDFIKEDATAQITKIGLIGNPIIIISPGKSSTKVTTGELIASNVSSDTKDLIESLKGSGENIETITQEVKKLVEGVNSGQGLIGELFTDKQLANEFKSALLKIEVTSKNTAIVTGDISSIIKHIEQNKHGLISTLVTDTTFSTMFHQGLSNFTITTKNTAQLTGDFEELFNRTQKGTNALGLILTDTAFANHLKKSTKNLDEDLLAAQHNFLLKGFFRKKK